MPTADSSLVRAARQWVVDNYPYNRDHLIRTLEWLDRIAPEASEAVRLAALTHDMERAFPGPDQPVNTSLIDPVYEQAHADRSARIVGDWLRAQGAEPDLVDEVARLIRAHETGGWHEADLVQAADSLSFLDTNIDLFLGFVRSGRFSADLVRQKFDLSRDRIRIPHLRDLAVPLTERAQASLAALVAEQQADAKTSGGIR
jgi:hypothetical protein